MKHIVLIAVATAGAVALAATASVAQMKLMTAPAPSGSTKVCAVFLPGNWRTMTPVPGNWSLDDCRSTGKTVGASMLQVACFWTTDNPGGVAKYSFGKAANINGVATPALLPPRNCGW